MYKNINNVRVSISHRIYLVFILLFLSQFCTSSENKFDLAGFDNPDRIVKFLEDLQNSVKNNKKRHIATLILFPFTATVSGKDIEIDSMVIFLENYDQIFNKKIKKSVLDAKVDNLSVRSNGVMIGRGDIWFSSYTIGENKVIAITAINN